MQAVEPLVSVLIVTRNRITELARSVESAFKQTYPNIEIVVVDNASTDGTPEMIRRQFPQVRLVAMEHNLGCPSGRNAGFKHCLGRYIYMLDDDGFLKEDAIAVSVARAELDPATGVVMSQVHEYEDGRLVRKRPESDETATRRASFSGGCSLIRSDVVRTVGGFPEDFFRQQEEEFLALRMLEAGYVCVLEPASVMHHAPSASGRDGRMIAFYNLRNSNRTCLRLWPFPVSVLRPLVILWHAFRFMITLRYPALPLRILWWLGKDLGSLSTSRKPVSWRTFRQFRQLRSTPVPLSPLLRARKNVGALSRA